MIKARRVQRGDRASADDINRLWDAIEELRDAPPGPGLTKSADGTMSVAPSRRTESSKQAEYSGLVELDSTQGVRDVDDYDSSVDRKQCLVMVVTDIQYDAVTHELTFRKRGLTLTRGSVTAESDPLTLITTAVPHPGS